jgi:hypothetical protein
VPRLDAITNELEQEQAESMLLKGRVQELEQELEAQVSTHQQEQQLQQENQQAQEQAAVKAAVDAAVKKARLEWESEQAKRNLSEVQENHQAPYKADRNDDDDNTEETDVESAYYDDDDRSQGAPNQKLKIRQILEKAKMRELLEKGKAAQRQPPQPSKSNTGEVTAPSAATPLSATEVTASAATPTQLDVHEQELELKQQQKQQQQEKDEEILQLRRALDQEKQENERHQARIHTLQVKLELEDDGSDSGSGSGSDSEKASDGETASSCSSGSDDGDSSVSEDCTSSSTRGSIKKLGKKSKQGNSLTKKAKAKRGSAGSQPHQKENAHPNHTTPPRSSLIPSTPMAKKASALAQSRNFPFTPYTGSRALLSAKPTHEELLAFLRRGGLLVKTGRRGRY